MLPGVTPGRGEGPGRGAPGRGACGCGRGIARSAGCAEENGLLPTRGGRGAPGLGPGAAGRGPGVGPGCAGAAAAGGVCKSNCCRIFSEHLGKSFGRYLTEYRLNKSLALLRNTDKTVTEIAYQTGFSGASYFTEQFTKSMGMTPTRYRKGMHA